MLMKCDTSLAPLAVRVCHLLPGPQGAIRAKQPVRPSVSQPVSPPVLQPAHDRLSVCPSVLQSVGLQAAVQLNWCLVASLHVDMMPL